jgi:hypothetical protein
MKFFDSCTLTLEGKKLQKVRVKVDPVWAQKLGPYNAPFFEGYILQEQGYFGATNTPEVKVFIVNVPPGYNPIQQVNREFLEPVKEDEPENVPVSNYSKLTLLKKAILDKVAEMGKDKDDPGVMQIINSKDIGFIETYLRQLGLTEEDLLGLYRKCFKKC